MVVGKHEKSDISFSRDADLIVYGTRYKDQNVYSDKKSPNRRDVFISSSIAKRYKRLPKTAKISWMGKKYNASLSFRYARGGRRIPVYQFKV